MVPLLSGIKILELSSVVMGPLTGQILADLGADVIKIEPLSGDIARESYPTGPLSKIGAMYVNNNRNKKVIALDLKHESGKAIARRLMSRADVFLHNLRTEAIERLGFGYSAAVGLNPNIIYCSAIGYGQAGRYRNRPAYDDVIQAASGLAGLTRSLGLDPAFVPSIVADKVGALYTVYGILAALISRLRGASGSLKVEMPMFEALVSFLLNEHLSGATFKSSEASTGNVRVLSPNRRPHRTKDDWIVVLPYTKEHWIKFLTYVGRTDVLAEQWFRDAPERNRRIDDLYGIVGTSLTTKDTAEWVSILSDLDIPFSRVNAIEDLLEDPHLKDVGFFDLKGVYPPDIQRAIPQPVVFSGIKEEQDRSAPSIGFDSREILGLCGYTRDEIESLFAQGVVRDGQGTSQDVA